MTRQRSSRKTVRTVQRRLKLGPTTAKYIGLSVLAILAVIMLTQSSSNSTAAYEQNELKKQISNVDQDVQRLQLEAKRAQSLQNIQQTTVKDQMQEVNSAEFVEPGQVAGVSTTKP